MPLTAYDIGYLSLSGTEAKTLLLVLAGVQRGRVVNKSEVEKGSCSLYTIVGVRQTQVKMLIEKSTQGLANLAESGFLQSHSTVFRRKVLKAKSAKALSREEIAKLRSKTAI